VTNLQRRLRKLEVLIIDDAGLVPHSPKWLAYWTEQVDKLFAGEALGPGVRIPLGAWDAVYATANAAVAPVAATSSRKICIAPALYGAVCQAFRSYPLFKEGLKLLG
jgi:DNA replication protein DnaC